MELTRAYGKIETRQEEPKTEQVPHVDSAPPIGCPLRVRIGSRCERLLLPSRSDYFFCL